MWKTSASLRRSLFVGTLILELLWCLSLATASAFAYLNTTVPGTDGASLLPLRAAAALFGALALVSLGTCWQTSRQVPRRQPLWWVAAVFAGELLIFLVFVSIAWSMVYFYFSGALLCGDYSNQ